MNGTRYHLRNVSIEWMRPHAATKLALIDARMAKVRGDLRRLTAELREASAKDRGETDAP